MADDIVVSFDDYVPAGSGCGLGGLGSFERGRLVRVDVERDGREMSFMVEADLVHVPAAAGRTVAGKTGYLRLRSFGASADRAAGRELQTLLDSGIETLVVDLRGNPGGFLHTVINIASMFLNDRQVVIQEVSRLDTLEHLVTGHGGLSNPAVLPIAVAVDQSSASASEVLTLALRDHGLATVVGTTTYGKNHRSDHRGCGIAPRHAAGRRPRDGVQVVGPRWRERRRRDRARRGTQPLGLLASDWAHPPGGGRGGAAGAAPADIDLGTERFDAVEALTVDGVLAGTGCGLGLFCPGDPIPRWMMAVWLARVVDGGDPEPVSASRFVDVDAGQWWAGHVERLAELGITVGCVSEPAQFCPDDPVTRAQTATFLNRAFLLDSAVPPDSLTPRQRP